MPDTPLTRENVRLDVTDDGDAVLRVGDQDVVLQTVRLQGSDSERLTASVEHDGTNDAAYWILEQEGDPLAIDILPRVEYDPAQLEDDA